MQPQRVCYFTDSSGYGGAEKALLLLMLGLDRNRWSPVLVVHPYPGLQPLIDEARASGISICHVAPMPDGADGARRVIQFARMLRRLAPRVFHAHLTWPLACKYGLVGAIAARVPAIVATQQLITPFAHTWPVALQQRLLGRGVGRYIAVSHDTAASLARLFRRPPNQLSVIHNAVESQSRSEQRDPALRSQLARGKPAVALVPARLDPFKGHDVLLDAARGVDGVQFVLAGEGSERRRLEAWAKELRVEDRVTFLGFRRDMPALNACADIVVLPSLMEGLPLSVLEAMKAAVPVVATAVGGTPEAVVDGFTGLLVPPSDAGALAQAIRRVVDDRPLAARLGRAGARLAAERFGVERMVSENEAVYEELLRGRG